MKTKLKPDPYSRTLTGYCEDKNNSNAAQETKETEEENSLLAEVKRLQGEISRLREEVDGIKVKGASSKTGVRYRKNKRVIYIPKKPLYDKVLDRLRQRTDEPMRVTIKKVFEVAAKLLGLL